MNQHESLLLTLAEQQLRHLLPPRLIASIEAYFHQARSDLQNSGKAKLEKEWLKIIYPNAVGRGASGGKAR